MRENTIRFGTFIGSARVARIGSLIEGGKRKKVFTLTDGTRIVAMPGTWVESAQPGRRDLSAGPVRESHRVELIDSVRNSQGRRRGDEGGRSLSSRRTA